MSLQVQISYGIRKGSGKEHSTVHILIIRTLYTCMYINSQNSIILEQENSWILTNPLLGYVFIVEISRVEYSLPDPSSLFSVHRYKKCAVAKIQPRTGQYKFSFSSSCIRSPNRYLFWRLPTENLIRLHWCIQSRLPKRNWQPLFTTGSLRVTIIIQ